MPLTGDGAMPATGDAQPLATAPDGATVERVQIANGGTTATLMTWGASLTDFRREELPYSLVLGSPEFQPYLKEMRHYGAIVGPVANRIGGGHLTVDGHTFDLERNEKGVTTLHGGSTGTSVRNWRLDGYDRRSCILRVRHADGESGFPGNIDVTACYSLDDKGALWLDIEAAADASTFCNLAHHSYWNLDGTADIASHRLTVRADSYLPVGDLLIPLGDPAPVAGTRFDYREMAPVLVATGELLDHNFCLDRNGAGLAPACRLVAGGACLDVSATERGLQVYDGTGLNSGSWNGHGGHPYGRHAGIAIEPQNWPDAPNRPTYPSARLEPGQTYRQTSVFRVTVGKT